MYTIQALESEKVPWQQLTQQQQQRQLQHAAEAAEAAEAARAAAEARLKQVMAEATEASGTLFVFSWLCDLVY
jgi:hypothetical protein